MSLKVCSLASGSKGNCIFVGSERTSLLIDAGVSPSRIKASLCSIGEQMPRDVLVTHSHTDHYRYVPALCEKGVTLHPCLWENTYLSPATRRRFRATYA